MRCNAKTRWARITSVQSFVGQVFGTCSIIFTNCSSLLTFCSANSVKGDNPWKTNKDVRNTELYIVIGEETAALGLFLEDPLWGISKFKRWLFRRRFSSGQKIMSKYRNTWRLTTIFPRAISYPRSKGLSVSSVNNFFPFPLLCLRSAAFTSGG